jgi:hypothetical protein
MDLLFFFSTIVQQLLLNVFDLGDLRYECTNYVWDLSRQEGLHQENSVQMHEKNSKKHSIIPDHCKNLGL